MSKFAQEALAANAAFTRMVQQGYALGPAIATAVGAISNLVSGLFAFVAQVGSAAPAMFALVGAFAALGQAMLAAKLAFSGIGAAFKELTSKGRGGANTAKRVESAERNLARVLEQNREALTRANERLAEAEERLTEARKEAAEWLQQLNFDAEDAALAEQRAVLALEDARLSLMRVQDLPPNSRARQEAELAYAEADLNLRRAIDRNQDLAVETEEANAKGVEGSEQVVNATKGVQEAIDDRARTERDALRSLIDAQNALNEARNAGGGGGGQEALSKLSEEARKFVEYLVSIKGATQGLKAAAGRLLFPQLQTALDNIINKLFPAFEPILEATGDALGKSAVDFANVVTEANNLEKFERVGKNNTYVIGNLGKVVGNLYDSFLSLMDAADPLIRRFTDWVVTLTDGWRESLNTKNATGELRDMFNKAGDAAAQIGDIIGNIGGALMNLGEAAAGPGSGGQQLMDTFQGATERFLDFTETILKDGSAEQFFRDVADNFTKISGLLSDVVGGFISFGNNQEIGEVADKLREAGPAVSAMMDKLITAGPGLAETFSKLLETINIFTESGAMDAFYTVLSAVLDIINAIFGNEVALKILAFTAPIMGTVKAFSLVGSVGMFFVKAFAGYIVKIDKFIRVIGKLKKAAIFTKLIAGIKAVGVAIKAAFIANPVGMIILAIVAVIAIVVIMYKKFKWFRDFVNAAWEMIKNAFSAVWNFIKDNWKLLVAILGGPIGIVIALFFKFKDRIFAVVGGIIGWIKDNWKKVQGFLVNPIQSAVSLIIGFAESIVKAFVGVFNWLARAWNNTLGGFTLSIPAFLGFDGFSITVPEIPEISFSGFGGGDESSSTASGGGGMTKMASGGIVKSPTIAMIGEAGREAVIPLTRPLRAMQIMQDAGLTGLARAAAVTSAVGASNYGARPFTINVYPSQGMNEVELAALVGRQVTVQLRKGTL